ncbi:MAG: hypothetical protein ACOX5G_00255 [Kiritimatiellia bacterium]|jgi:hypothetical protein
MKILPVLALVFALLAGAGLFVVGCESTSADEVTVEISPGYVVLRVGESVVLTASGWDNFTWSCTAALGHLSANKGKSVVYTAAAQGTQTIVAKPITGGAPAPAPAAAGGGANTNKVVATDLGSGSATIVQK